MTPLQFFIGPLLAASLLTMFLVYVVSVICRSVSREGRVTTFATSRPVLTGVFLAAFWCGALLLIIRLGVIA
ncbi:hypothetical protein [Corynebacterium sp.]|uniref:hypothetical protein n=1 Tax=Corynebacterium sp. TaxID=1720 RepID=UPI00264A0563|nr:hypothetical protein [Corynebacterium sp.]MDN5721501.1 hypothetical protein [Corynebacterium sp.]MDN6281633.1 hypothetical protein [Corynebacterium sp.]MDN6351879.1 hypothetical protein [Corynebacterium sp.]MDN6367338.1 hypothetical protein [Corynebacterium sp.]MDN6374866.1 hypothetical protein [Corynebacterium sp.]